MKRTNYSLKEIAAHFGGLILGNPETTVNQVATLENAQAGHLAFLANIKYRPQLSATRASAVIVGASDKEVTDIPRIVCENPYVYFAKVSALLNPVVTFVPGIHPSSVIAEGAYIDPTAHVGPHVVIGTNSKVEAGCVIMEGCSIGAGVSIGINTRLYPHVVVYQNCILGSRIVVHSGVVIGADGFGIAMDEGRWLKIPQIGRVVIGDDVEIGANTTIDRGALDDTVIEEGVKLDNQIQIAHNVRVGAHTAIAACVGIAGSASVGRHCRIGGGTGILGHTQIADNVEISSFTMIGKSIREPGTYTGIFPFSSHEVWRKNAAQLRHLDDLADKIKALQQEIETLRSKS